VPRHPLAAIVLALAALAAAPACRRETPEAAIRRVLDDGCEALQARDVARAVRHLSPDYRDKLSRTNQQMRGLAFWVLRRGPVKGDSATVTTVAHCFLGREHIDRLSDLVPQGAQRFELTLRFAREGGDWKLRALDGDWTNPDLGM